MYVCVYVCSRLTPVPQSEDRRDMSSHCTFRRVIRPNVLMCRVFKSSASLNKPADSLAPISIIVCGTNTPQGAAMLKMASENSDKFHTPVDVRKWMHGDEVGGWKISHWNNADFLPCQLSLLRLSGFVVCVDECAQRMAATVDEARAWVLYCTAGQHRSDGIAKAISSRVFNAEVVGGVSAGVNVGGYGMVVG